MSNLTHAILVGQHDDELDDLTRVIARRKKIRGAQFFSTLRIGAKVQFVETIRPQYLSGQTATVVGKKISKLIVKLDHPVGRFYGDIRVPPTLVEPVVEEDLEEDSSS